MCPHSLTFFLTKQLWKPCARWCFLSWAFWLAVRISLPPSAGALVWMGPFFPAHVLPCFGRRSGLGFRRFIDWTCCCSQKRGGKCKTVSLSRPNPPTSHANVAGCRERANFAVTWSVPVCSQQTRGLRCYGGQCSETRREISRSCIF